MAIPNKQIGWSEKANLLWEISRQLDRLNTQMCTGGCPTTTTTTTTAPLVLIDGYYSYEGCVPCEAGCLLFGIILYAEQACVDLITVGCHLYVDSEGTTNATEGYYERWDGTPGFLYIDANGLVANIDVCPQP